MQEAKCKRWSAKSECKGRMQRQTERNASKHARLPPATCGLGRLRAFRRVTWRPQVARCTLQVARCTLHAACCTLHVFPTTLMLRVSFSPAPDCVDGDCWNWSFSTRTRHQEHHSSCSSCLFFVAFTLVLASFLECDYHYTTIFWTPHRAF